MFSQNKNKAKKLINKAHKLLNEANDLLEEKDIIMELEGQKVISVKKIREGKYFITFSRSTMDFSLLP